MGDSAERILRELAKVGRLWVDMEDLHANRVRLVYQDEHESDVVKAHAEGRREGLREAAENARMAARFEPGAVGEALGQFADALSAEAEARLAAGPRQDETCQCGHDRLAHADPSEGLQGACAGCSCGGFIAAGPKGALGLRDDAEECGRCGHTAFHHANFGRGECQVPEGCSCYEFKERAVGPKGGKPVSSGTTKEGG